MKLSNALSCLGLCAILSVSSCSTTQYTGDLASIVSTKTLVVGTNAGYKPFEYENSSGEILGYDVKVVNLIDEAINTKYSTTVKVVWKNMDFDGLIGSLQSNQIDLIAAAFSITEERAVSVLFSDTYFTADTVVVTASTNTTITDMDSLKSSKCGAQLGTVQGDTITGEGWNSSNQTLTDISNLVLAIKAGTLDALVVEKPVAQQIISSQTDLKIIDTIAFEDDGGYGLASHKGTGADLISLINDTIKTNTDNGTLDNLYIEAANEASSN